MISKQDSAYAAGFFDGEGCVFVTTCSHYHYREEIKLELQELKKK